MKIINTNFILLLVVFFSFATTNTEAVAQCNEVCRRSIPEQDACCNANGYHAGIGCRNNQMFCGPPR